MVEHHGGAAVGAGLDHQVAHGAAAVGAQGHGDRGLELRLGGDGHHVGAAGGLRVGPGHRRRPVAGHVGPALPPGADGVGDLLPGHADAQAHRVGPGRLEQRGQQRQGGELPLLGPGRRSGEVLHGVGGGSRGPRGARRGGRAPRAAAVGVRDVAVLAGGALPRRGGRLVAGHLRHGGGAVADGDLLRRPDGLAAGGRHVGEHHGAGLGGLLVLQRLVAHDLRAQPTAPSICSSMSRFSSRAYSIGSSRAMGSTKPRTIIAIASSSAMPRLIR